MFEKITDWLHGAECKKVSVDEVHELLKFPAKDDVAFIDVRRGDEWNTGYIQGFRHIALADLPLHATQLATLSKVYFICHSGNRSLQACAILKRAGSENGYTVSGGIAAWHKKGYPIVSQTTGSEATPA